MPPTVLLTIGRMPKGLDLARGFRAAGARVIVADPFAWHVSRLSRDVAKSVRVRAPRTDRDGFLEDLARIVHDERVDLVVPVSEEASHTVGLADRLPTGTRMFASAPSLVRSLHDKLAFNARCHALGLAAPRTALLGTEAARVLVAEHDVVLKPQWSCGGTHIAFVDRGHPLPAATSEPMLVQQRLRGAHRSTFTVAIRGEPVATSVYRGTVFGGTVASAFERLDGATDILTWVEQLVRATQYHGFLSLDFIDDDEGRPFAIECNPRVTSGVHFFDTHTIAAAVLADDARAPVAFRERTRFQHFYATLMEAEGRLFRGKPSRAQWHALATSRDVVWSWRDPLPFLLMTPASWSILKPALFDGVPMSDGATRDIAWFAEDAAAAGVSALDAATPAPVVSTAADASLPLATT